MRWRVAALIALSGIAVVPAASGAGAPGHAATLSVSVTPRTGSARTHFVVSFRTALATGLRANNTYRVTAGGPGRGGCQASVAADAPATSAGSTVRVVLAPRASGWCAGIFRGQVWHVIAQPCPAGMACPEIVSPPLMVAGSPSAWRAADPAIAH